MKKSVLGLLCLMMLFSTVFAERIILGDVSQSNKSDFRSSGMFSSQIDIDLNSFDVSNDGQYDIITSEGLGTMALEEGNPSLPMVIKTVALPDYGDLSYVITIIKEVELEGEYNVKPQQQPLPEVINYKPTFVKNEAVYSSNSYFPEERVFITEPSIMRDMRFVRVYFSPFRYNPVTKKMTVVTECRIDFKTDMTKSTGPEPMSMFLTEEFVGLYQEMFDNYDAVAGYKQVETRIDRNNKLKNVKGDDFTGEGDYLIVVAGTVMSNKIKTFATYKAKLGYTPVIMHLSNATTTTSANIKANIQNAYTSWTIKPVYILMVGDADSTLYHQDTSTVLQCHWKRAADFGISYSYGIKAGYIPNDHFYALLNGTDYYADAYISRFNVKDTIKLNTIVNKTIAYETNPPMGDPTWFTHYIGLGARESGRIFDTTATQFWKNLKAYGWAHWDSLIETTSWTPSQTQVMDSMNDGSNIMLFRGHGAEGYDGDSDDGSGYAWFGGADKGYITMCTNEMIAAINQPTTVGTGFNFSPTCLAGNFAYPRAVRDSSSMGDYWTELNSKGGVGLYAATNVSYSYYNDSMSLGVSHAVVNRNNVMPTRNYARVTTYSKIYMETYAGPDAISQLESYLMNALGDPACIMYTKAPKNFIVSHTTSVETKLDTVTITVTDNTKAAVAGATVCLYDTLETVAIQQLALTDATGKATFINTYTKTGTMFLTVQKQDYIAYLGTVSITSATALNEVSLSGYYKNGTVCIKWITANPQLVEFYNIYRDGKFVKQISNESASYSEKNSQAGRKVYSVEVVNKDNSKQIYRIPVTIDTNSKVMFENNILSLTNVNSYKLINMSGQIINQEECRDDVSVYNLSNLTNGIYFVITDSGSMKKIEIMK